MSERNPRSANVLIKQVQASKPKATAEPVGDADGFGIHRTIKFDKTTSKWLAPILEETGDPRISGLELTDAGYLHVTFVGTQHADHTGEFPLDAAEEVVKSQKAGE